MSVYDDYSRGLIKYSSRDYKSLISDYSSAIKKLTELWQPQIDPNEDTTVWNPESDSDPGIILLKLLASTADMLGVNLDWVANEVFAPSVSQRKDAEKIFGLIGYTLGWYTAACTEVTFTNNTESPLSIDFGFNGSNFSTLNAYEDIAGNSRTITYNVLPMTNSYGATDSKSIRDITASSLNIFTSSDKVTLAAGDSCTRIAVEGELRYYSISVSQVKANNYKITLPSQHIDTRFVWIVAKANASDEDFLNTQWLQCETTQDFIEPEPRFAVTYDNYSNAQITISNYLNQLENYDSNWLVIYWIDCSGAIGCVGEDVLSNFLPAIDGQSELLTGTDASLGISNLSNTVELPNTYTVTGSSPETAKEAYFNSRNYINTWNSLVTLPDYNRFIRRESGVDCGLVIDCQKALEINLAIYNDSTLTTAQKSKKYITNYDFPEGDPIYDWKSVLNLTFDPSDPQKFVFATNFKTYTAMCFLIHNDFKDTSYGSGKLYKAQVSNSTVFQRYKPAQQFLDGIVADYKPLRAMSTQLEFGLSRIFNFYIVGSIYTKKPVSSSVGEAIVNKVREALNIYFAPANREFGVRPTMIEIMNTIEGADSRIRSFDGGSIEKEAITYYNCDIDYFNPISFARYVDQGANAKNLIIAPECIID